MCIAGSANVMGDSVGVVQNNQYGNIFVANETLLWTETRLNGGLEGGGGTLVTHRGSEEAFTFGYLPILRGELCTFKHYDTLLEDDT